MREDAEGIGNDRPETVTLTFSDHPSLPIVPRAADVARAASWCLDRGRYRLSAALAALAAELAEEELDAAVDGGDLAELAAAVRAAGTVVVPFLGSTRDEQPRTAQGESSDAQTVPTILRYLCGTCQHRAANERALLAHRRIAHGAQ